jgi:hypothetical protein
MLKNKQIGVDINSGKKRLIVVLGMHRSGTSAITRSLQVMGVELGDKFLPPQEDNITGFWEDADINAINIEILNSLGSEWHFLTPVQQTDIDILRKNGYFQQALEILEKKMSGTDIFGFKDPRLAKLFPFWKEVFIQSQLNVSYILSIRHPLSVSKSLEKRDGFDLEKGSLLWLEHIINSLVGTLGESCVLVDYDRLIQSPETEIKNIAKGLQLQIDPLQLQKFKTEFLDEGLRHTVYQLESLMLDKTILGLTQEVYSTLVQIAGNNVQLDDTTIKKKIEQWKNEFSRLIPVLVFIDKLDARIKGTIAQVAERDAQIQNLTTQINEITISKAWRVATLLRRISYLLTLRKK